MVRLERRENKIKETSYKNNNLGKSLWDLKVKSVQRDTDTPKKRSKHN